MVSAMMEELVQVIDCLSTKQVDDVLSSIDDTEYQPTTIFTDKQGEECSVNTDIRSNTRVCLADVHPAASIMHVEMNRILEEYRDRMIHNVHRQYGRYPIPGTFKTSCYREQIQVLRYQPGEHYTWHSDEATDKKVNEYHRTMSIVLYLTDGFEGGATEFPWGEYKPKAGQALVFPSNWCFPHQSQRLISGEKKVAVTWYHSHYIFD
jgi:hypothetical protein